MKTALVSILVALWIPTAFAKDQILCKPAKRGPDVVITLSSFSKFDRVFNCVSGDFVVDLSGCAPNGAFALHYPTGAADIQGVVDRWQDYMKHMGGVTSSGVSDEDLTFTGGFVFPGSGYKESWRFSVSRLTGVGNLTQADHPAQTYRCKKITPKF